MSLKPTCPSYINDNEEDDTNTDNHSGPWVSRHNQITNRKPKTPMLK